MRLLLSTLVFALCVGCSGSSTPAPNDPADPVPDPDPTPPADPPPEPPAPPPATALDVLVLMSSGVANVEADPDLRVEHLFNVTNDVFAANGIDAGFEVAHVENVAYADGTSPDTALDELTFQQDPAFDAVPALRDQHDADLVVLFQPYANDGLCGFAWVGGFQQNGDFSDPINNELAYAVVAIDCADYTLAHEFGHNMGLAHSRRAEPDGGTHPYSAGHGVDNDFVTIMASSTNFNAPQLPTYSSPDLDCNGLPCGVDFEDPVNGADAVRTLTESASQVAAYR